MRRSALRLREFLIFICRTSGDFSTFSGFFVSQTIFRVSFVAWTAEPLAKRKVFYAVFPAADSGCADAALRTNAEKNAKPAKIAHF